MQQPKENKMGVMPVGRLVLTMSLPMILSMLVQALYNIVDSVYVGIFDQDALSAVSFSFPAQNLMIGVAAGTAVGVNALLSRSLGEKDQEKANRVAENGIFLALVGYLLFLVFGLTCSRIFFTAQTEVASIVAYGQEYLSVICCCSFGLFFQMMFERLMQSTGRTMLSMITQASGAVINIILDPVFIFGPGEGPFSMGAFGLGAKGAAIATVIGQCVACAAAVVLNHHFNPDVQLSMHRFRPDWKMIGRIYAIGVPSMIMVGIGSVMTFLMNKILIVYTTGKEISATVFGVYFKLNSFFFMPVFGLNNGVIPIVAYNYGAKKRRRLLQAVRISVIYACAFMLLGMAAFFLIPEILLGFFHASPQMVQIGVPALRIIATSFLFAGVCIALGSVFQALGHGMMSMLVSFVRQILVLLPSAFFLALWGQRIGNDNLVWLSYPIAEVFSLLVTVLCFRRLYRDSIALLPEEGEEARPEAET